MDVKFLFILENKINQSLNKNSRFPSLVESRIVYAIMCKNTFTTLQPYLHSPNAYLDNMDTCMADILDN